MNRATQLAVGEQEEGVKGPQVRLRLAVIDRGARPDAHVNEQAISLTKTFPAPGEVGACSVFRGCGNLTVANLLLARQVLSQALSQVCRELGVDGHADEVD